MKALSVKQPWASLVAQGIKPIENRTWPTKFRGRIYIHASAKLAANKNELGFLFNDDQRNSKDFDWHQWSFEKEYLTSSIIGEVDIIDCVINHPSIWAEKTRILSYTVEGEPLYAHKPIYNWVLANPILYDEPILNVKGKLSFWYPDNDIIECIGCSQKFDSEFMAEDSIGEKYCAECEKILFPIMKKDYEEIVVNGEIELN